MKRLSLVLLLVLASLSQTFAQSTVDKALAYKTAQAFADAHQVFKGQSLDLVSSEVNYIYNIGNQGFIIISGNTVLPPVLGWSNQGNFPNMEDAPENLPHG